MRWIAIEFVRLLSGVDVPFLKAFVAKSLKQVSEPRRWRIGIATEG